MTITVDRFLQLGDRLVRFAIPETGKVRVVERQGLFPPLEWYVGRTEAFALMARMFAEGWETW